MRARVCDFIIKVGVRCAKVREHTVQKCVRARARARRAESAASAGKFLLLRRRAQAKRTVPTV